MEDYVATDQRPVDRCLAHVSECDIYVCLLAWRYGYTPDANNPTRASVTDLEYRRATEKEIPRLVFLLAEDAPWPPRQCDSHTGEGDAGHQVREFRKRLENDRIVSFFVSAEDLSTEVGIATANFLHSQAALDDASVAPWGGFEELTEVGLSMYSSEASEIGRLVDRLIFETPDRRVVQVDLRGGNYWWSTRLYLLAALLGELSGIEALAFIDGANVPKRFVGLASPVAVQRALGEVQVELEEAYRNAWISAVKNTRTFNDRVHWIVEEYSRNLPAEIDIKNVVSAADLRKWLGTSLNIACVERSDSPVDIELVLALLESGGSLVPLSRRGELVSVVDRLNLAVRIAKNTLEKPAMTKARKTTRRSQAARHR